MWLGHCLCHGWRVWGSGAWILGEGGLGVRWQCGSTESCLVLGVDAELAFDDFDRLGEEKGFVHEEMEQTEGVYS